MSNALPRIVCLMVSSLDGRLHPSRWTRSPDGAVADWSRAYERLHDDMAADGWIVGRTAMAEMAKGKPHPPVAFAPPSRPHHFAHRRGPFAIAVDRSGKLHFAKPEVGGDHVVVLLGPDVEDAHLAELVADGVSYIVAADEAMTLAPLLVVLRAELNVALLMLEGGAQMNGAFLGAGLVQELHVVLAPALDGSPGPAIVEAGDLGLREKIALSLTSCAALGAGALHLRYAVNAA